MKQPFRNRLTINILSVRDSLLYCINWIFLDNHMKKFKLNKVMHKNKNYDMKLGMKGNSVKQTHFRDQLLQ